MSKQDRNTALTILIVLIVCITALVAVGGSLWSLVGPGVNSALASIGVVVNVATANYNFEVPGQDGSNSSTTENSSSSLEEITLAAANQGDSQTDTQVQSESHNYRVNGNFTVLGSSTERVFAAGVVDGILDDLLKADYESLSGGEFSQPLRVQIPNIDLDSKAYYDVEAKFALQNGFAFHPNSHQFGEGEVVLTCHRRYLAAGDPRSCYYLDKVFVGDEIIVNANGLALNYSVVGISIQPASSSLVYNASEDRSYLRIVTAHPINNLNSRLIVLAELNE